MQKPSNTDEYISSFPEATQKLLQEIRKTIKNVVPEAEEVISYGIPTFYLKGNLVHFAGYAKHIGFYPGAGGIEAFKDKISAYKNAKGSVQFPIDKPLPLDLVTEIVKFRVIQNMEKAALKKKIVKKKTNQPTDELFGGLSAPAQRALANNGITDLKKLATYSEKELLKFHGLGPSAIPKLNALLQENGLAFKN